MFYTTYHDSPIGRITLAAKDDALAGLWLENQKYFLASLKGEQTVQRDTPVLDAAKAWLDCYFAGEKPGIEQLAITPAGSPFRRAVWHILCQIPYGQTMTYGEIASAIAAQSGQAHMSAQAIGGAVAHNPISVIIPCHRVVGSGGSLTGYAGGIHTKIWLLTHEGADMSRLFIPRASASRQAAHT